MGDVAFGDYLEVWFEGMDLVKQCFLMKISFVSDQKVIEILL